MRRDKIAKLIGLGLGAALLAGCAKTPESSLIKQKGDASLKNYEEGETLGGIEEAGTEASEENTGESSASEGANSGTEEESAGGDNRLKAALGAPDTYQSTVTDETGKLQILTDAVVEIPDASKVSAISVSQHPFGQEEIDRVSEAFFPGAKFYNAFEYDIMTKADWQKRVEVLKGYVAEGNLDPFEYGTDENGNYMYDIYRDIEQAEESYQTAPETVTPKEVHPQYGLEIDDGTGEPYVMNDGFYGIAVTPEGEEYSYTIKSYGSMPMDITIEKQHETPDSIEGFMWSEYSGVKNYGVPDEEGMAEAAGITLAEAQEIADEKVKALDLPYMEMTDWEYGILWQGDGGFNVDGIQDIGYVLHYTRKINGIPIIYTMSYGGSYEDMDSEMEAWCYEVLNFYITEEGIDKVEFVNQYDIGEVKTENLNLMSFDEIMEIYEKMMVIQNADVLNYESFRTYHINRIAFGYSRIYEPASSSTTGLLVPVWEFFGDFETQYVGNDGTVYDNKNSLLYQGYLTINAIDGSIINRELGY